ncbi:MAG: MBL fold metallo-hydrolase [Gemmatimonadota bacterium]
MKSGTLTVLVLAGLVIAALAIPASLTRNASPPAPALPDSTTIVLLGTGMPRPNPEASGPATAVVAGSRVFLFDAGPGVMRQLAAAGLPINGVTALFITHLHSDHTLGYPDLILTSWVMGRRQPLQAFGPPGLQAMTDHILAAWREDEEVRTTGLEHQTENGYAVAVHEIAPGVVYDSGGVRITAIPVPHGSWKYAFGYRIDAPGRSIVISGDTRFSPALEEAARGVDILIHEAYPASHLKIEERPDGSEWPSYMRSFHTSDVEVGQLAAAAGPGLVILHHLVRMGGTDEELLAGVRQGGYTGRVVIGKDLERY